MSADERPVSVVMPVGRVDDDLPLQLDALADQTYEGPWELVLSLNTADRDQRRMLEAMLESRETLPARIVDSSDLRSASHARNVGAEAANGDLLLFCDGDDLVDSNWMTALIAAVDGFAAAGGFLEEERLAIPGQEGWRPPSTPNALPEFLGRAFLITANMAVERSAFEKVGGFDTTLLRGEDIAFSWDLLEHDLDLVYAPDAVIYYRHRRGLKAMMLQHYLYGKGLSQLLALRGIPGSDGPATGLRALKPNNQPVDHKGLAYFCRRGSIAAGRVVGLVQARLDR